MASTKAIIQSKSGNYELGDFDGANMEEEDYYHEDN
jgi:hypothetical protein